MFLHLIFPIIVYLTLLEHPHTNGEVQGLQTKSEDMGNEMEVLATPSPTSTPIPVQVNESESQSVVNSGDSHVSVKIHNNQVEVSTSGGGSGAGDLSSFQYPGALVKESSESRVVLESNDSPGAVTEWYQRQIESRGMNTKSFVKTNSNGSILNKLAGAGNGSIAVEISAQEGSNPTKIVVTQE